MKVLIVEDSSFARMAVMKVMSTLLPDAEFLEAGDGESGLAVFLHDKPDLVLTDLLMPKMSGEAMIAAIRQQNIHVPIIVMTANIQKPAREKVEAMGITGFVTKPVNGDSVAKLRNLLVGLGHAD